MIRQINKYVAKRNDSLFTLKMLVKIFICLIIETVIANMDMAFEEFQETPSTINFENILKEILPCVW